MANNEEIRIFPVSLEYCCCLLSLVKKALERTESSTKISGNNLEKCSTFQAAPLTTLGKSQNLEGMLFPLFTTTLMLQCNQRRIWNHL